MRVGLKLTEEHQRELTERLRGVLEEFMEKEDPSGIPTSLFIAHHLDKAGLPD
jgi:hypothetical protein